MIPFAKVSELELAAATEANLTAREFRVWLAVKMRAHNGWAITRRELEQTTKLRERPLQVVLAALERKGFVRRTYAGQRFDPWGRFKVETPIPGDRGTPIGTDRASSPNPDRRRSGYTFQGSDQRDPVTDPPVRPSRAGARASAREDGRTDDRFQSLEQLARELWPDVAQPGLFIGRLLELAPFAAVDKLASYLRHGSQTVQADLPLAVLCTRDRWEASQRKRRGARSMSPPAEKPSAGEKLSALELAELAGRAARKR